MHDRSSRTIMTFLLLFGIAACAHPQTKPPVSLPGEALTEANKQKELVFRAQQAEIAHLQTISDRLRIGAAPLCGNLVPRFGWAIANRFSFKPDIRDVAVSQYGLGNRLKVIRLASDGPAARAGIMMGDEILQAADTVLSGADAGGKFDVIVQDSLREGAAAKLEILRDGQTLPVDVTGVPACNYPISLMAGEKINAGTNGRRVFVSEGMVRFAHDDTELALVVAHEMSHGIRSRVEAQRKNARTGSAIGALFDILAAVGGTYGNTFSSAGARIGAGAYSQEFEAEADYVSLYVMALSGYDITHAPDFWRRLATVRPEDIDKGYTHPTTAQRFVAMETAVLEIQDKQAEGVQLRPEMKNSPQKH